MKDIIVTGTSRGLGEALALKIIERGDHLISVSRSENEKLSHLARKEGSRLTHIAADLSRPDHLETAAERVMTALSSQSEGAYLVNNAGILGPIRSVGRYEAEDARRNVAVNLSAAIALTGDFIRWTEGWEIPRRVVNISSGAGRKPKRGWSVYCAAKAGLDMFTRVAGAEQEVIPNGVLVMSFAPGVLNTGMQEEIRSSDISDFPEVERFIGLYRDGKLLSPDFVAERVLRLLEIDGLENGGCYDISDFPLENPGEALR
jgi:benzil reductase ((S)-benzoin forming)